MDVKERYFGAETNGFESTTYAEKDGENIDPRTTLKAFDYVVQFLVEAPNSNIDSANARIKAFNEALYASDGDIKTFKPVTFYDDYNKVKIVGYPDLIAKPTSFWRDRNGVMHDAVQIEWTIRVNNPNLCDFNL
jgi:hypothetical protein